MKTLLLLLIRFYRRDRESARLNSSHHGVA